MKADLPEPSRGRRGFRLFRRGRRATAARAAKPDRDTVRSIESFVSTRIGVEAYVEPETRTSPASVVLVAADGEWIRKSIPDPGWLSKLTKATRVPVYEVARVGYPKRMREYRRHRGGGGPVEG